MAAFFVGTSFLCEGLADTLVYFSVSNFLVCSIEYEYYDKYRLRNGKKYSQIENKIN